MGRIPVLPIGFASRGFEISFVFCVVTNKFDFAVGLATVGFAPVLVGTMDATSFGRGETIGSRRTMVGIVGATTFD